jgi:DNA-binding transcriptional LysR family regulator
MTILDSSLASDLWVFRIAADSPSFRTAAERLSVTQGAVTQRIQRLEGRLGVKLFRRGERSLRLSPQGRLLFEATIRGFDDISDALKQLRSEDRRATVRISCVPSLALEWLTPRMSRFLAQHGNVNIEIFGETHELDRARMSAEGVDIGIRYGPEPPKGANIAFSFPESIFPVISPKLKIEVLSMRGRGHGILLLHDARAWERVPSPTAEWDYWLKAYGVPWSAPRQDLFFNLAQLAYRSAIEGVGIAIGRGLIVKRYISEGLLVPALDEAPLQVTALYALTQPHRTIGPIATVLAWLHEQMETT